ncbi:MaoC family dehydratase [Sorangium sp. So ce1097]|uniref:MaoC family dehydratase n=1 Tax=Sorangium sp. So ce1097 TaxID=3133330 RepID=UPI003F5F7821
MARVRSPRYGRKLDDFTVGAVYAHPWDVTVDEGMLALFAASFQDAMPTYASRVAARAVGLRDRPVSPLLLLNLGISFSVHDVSEQAIAHLAYIDVRFPDACYPGDTLRASSMVIGKKPVSTGDKGVVHVRTQVVNQDGLLVCSFERKALVPCGSVAERSADAPHAVVQPAAPPARLPQELGGPLPPAPRRGGFACFWDDLEVGDVITHEVGRTVGDSEHMQLATLLRNSHPLHLDERYCRSSSFAKTRVVHGGLVLSWVLALSSRDTAGCAVWDLGLDDGAHPSGVLAGDTLFAASKVIAREEAGAGAGSVTLRVVGVKNTPPRALLDQGADLFTPELGKTDGRVKEKVVEITRTLLVRRRG